jgi:hypothetical protein
LIGAPKARRARDGPPTAARASCRRLFVWASPLVPETRKAQERKAASLSSSAPPERTGLHGQGGDEPLTCKEVAASMAPRCTQRRQPDFKLRSESRDITKVKNRLSASSAPHDPPVRRLRTALSSSNRDLTSRAKRIVQRADDRAHFVVLDAVIDCLAIPSGPDESFKAKPRQLLRHRRLPKG